MRAGGGGRSDASKAVSAGLLGLQLLGMPIAVVARQGASGVAPPRVEVVTAEAKGAPRTTEEEMIGESSENAPLSRCYFVDWKLLIIRVACNCVIKLPRYEALVYLL